MNILHSSFVSNTLSLFSSSFIRLYTLRVLSRFRSFAQHADLLCDTGSLGQALSNVAGMAIASPNQHFAVILGDGELQEGQNYEALMTINHLKIKNITICIDRNGYQSDNKCEDMMNIDNLEKVLEGFGYAPVVVDGHDHAAVLRSLESTLNTETHARLPVVIFDTKKANGTSFMEPFPHPVTGLMYQPWHTKIPPWSMYADIVLEQLSQVTCSRTGTKAMQLWSTHRAKRIDPLLDFLPNTHRPTLPGVDPLNPGMFINIPMSSLVGTGKAFGRRLTQFVQVSSRDDDATSIHVVSCDLATSCGLNGIVGHERFHELGVSEQDAASFCGGLALEGKRRSSSSSSSSSSKGGQRRGIIPVLATYSNFLKRCFENIFINLISHAHCIYFGTYSGLCYHTDGKSHQSFADVRSFTGLPHLVVIDPFTELQAVLMLEHVLGNSQRKDNDDGNGDGNGDVSDVSDVAGLTQSYYFRLRRTPFPRLEEMYATHSKEVHNIEAGNIWNTKRDLLAPTCFNMNELDDNCVNVVFVTMGCVATQLALECVDAWSKRMIAHKEHEEHNQSRTADGKGDENGETEGRPAKRTKREASTEYFTRGMIVNPTEVVVVSTVGANVPLLAIKEGRQLYVTIEDDVGVLRELVLDSLSAAGHAPLPRVVSKTMTSEGPSFRTLEHCLLHHKFTVNGIEALL